MAEAQRRKPGSKPRYTIDQMVDALHKTRGLIHLTAKHLRCNPQTIINYCNKYPAVAAARDAARAEVLDLAEAKLFLAVQRGEPWAITFCLRTVGRSRGYGEQLDVHIMIQAAARKVADETGFSVEAILAEATHLLQEVNSEA